MRGRMGIVLASLAMAGIAPAKADGFATSGHVEADYRLANPDGPDNSIDIWALRGTMQARKARGLRLQAELGYEDYRLGSLTGHTLDGAVHASTRIGGDVELGAFVQGAEFTTANLFGLGIFGLDAHAREYIAGVQAAYIGEFGVIDAQAGAGKSRYGPYSGDRYALKLGAKALIGDNLRFDVEGAYNRLQGPGWDVNVYSLGAQGNYRFEETPLTVFARYEVDQLTYNAGGAEKARSGVQTVSAGVQVHFGSDSLRDATLKGPLWSANRAYYR